MKGVNLGLKVMKRLFAVFLVLGALMSVEAWGAKDNNKPTDITQTMSKDTNFVSSVYDELNSLTYKICGDLMNGAYHSIKSIFNNVISILLGLIAFFWLFKHLKTGTISREEVFKALIFVIVFVIVYVLFNSKDAYNGFKSLFDIPQHLVKAALSSSLNMSNVGAAMNQALVKPIMLCFDLIPEAFNNFVHTHDWFKFQYAVAPYFTLIIFFIYTLYLIMLLIVVIAVIIIQIYSIFLSCIYLTFLPITIPLLLIPQTKGIFFACVKAYIGISMYVPLTMIPISIVNSISTMMTSHANILLGNLFFYTLLGMITCIIAILLLYKMPTWISELLGVANQGVGAGGAIGMMKTAGMGLGAYGKGVASNILNSKSGGTALARTGLNIATMGMSGVASELKTGAKSMMKNGFKSTANFLKNKINPTKKNE